MKDKGYSLIEVLLSVVLLSIILLPVLSLFIQGHRFTNSAGLNTTAAAYGQEEMERLKASGYTYLKSKLSGNYYEIPEEDGQKKNNFTVLYTLQLISKDLQGVEDEIVVELILIKVYVKWFDKIERELVLTSYLAER